MNPIAIHAFNPGPMTGAGNWTYLIPGTLPTLIDAGQGHERHVEALVQALDGAPLAQVIVTHAHADHVAGAPMIAARMPDARFLKMPWAERDSKWPVPWEPLAAGDRVAAGDTTLEVVHTPGHAPDHICLWHPESGTLFGGDLVVAGSSVWIPTSLGGDLSDYLASLRRVQALAAKRILPSHGAEIDDPAAVLAEYIAHRDEREAQVVQALRDGLAEPEAIVERLYETLKQRLVPLAKESVLAHLGKLERDGRAARHGDRWHIIDP